MSLANSLILELKFLAFGTGNSELYDILDNQQFSQLGKLVLRNSENYAEIMVPEPYTKFVTSILKQPSYNVSFTKQAYRIRTLKNGKQELHKTRSTDQDVAYSKFFIHLKR